MKVSNAMNLTKMTHRPLRTPAPLAYFEASLSLESKNEDMEELTGNQSEDEVEDEPEDSWDTLEFVENSRRQKNLKMYQVIKEGQSRHENKF